MEKCLMCGNEENNLIKKSFISGLNNFECHNCSKKYKLPLSKRDKLVYRVVCGFFLLGFLVSLLQGTFLIPGILVIFPTIWLYKNINIEKAYNLKNPIRIDEEFKDTFTDTKSLKQTSNLGKTQKIILKVGLIIVLLLVFGILFFR